MKKIYCSVFVIAMIISGCNEHDKKTATPAAADSLTTTAKGPEEVPHAGYTDSATIMKNWIAYMTPGPEHKMLKSWDGKWVAEIKLWQKPGDKPELSKGSVTYRMVLGDRYQQATYTSVMMGNPVEGMGTLAFDNLKKVFISTYIDNVGTGLMKMEGTWDEAAKSMTLKGNCVDPASGLAKETEITQVFKVINKNTHFVEMFGPDADGKPFKMMEINYRRK